MSSQFCTIPCSKGYFKRRIPALLLRLFANVVVLVCADESSLLLGVADDGGESHLRCVLTGAPGFHHSGAIVDNDGGLLFFVTHSAVGGPH